MMKLWGNLSVKLAYTYFVFLFILFLPAVIHAASVCTHYASPSGTGNGLSLSSPFLVSKFWLVAKPGKTLCLLDGEYVGFYSMIQPTKGLSGTASAPITVRALNDGKATINGRSVNGTVVLRENDYFVIEGINAHHSSGSVVVMTYSDHNVVRRVAAWDAADANYHIFGVHLGYFNLLEDCAGWGIGRKIFDSSAGGNYTTIRRAWGRWEGSHFMGPKLTYTLGYNHYNMIVENSIGTWSGEKMKSTYTLKCNSGSTYSGCGKTFTNYQVDQPFGIFAVDQFNGSKIANSKVLGSIAYIRATDRYAASKLYFVHDLESFEISNSVAYVAPLTYLTVRRMELWNPDDNSGANLNLRSSSGVSGASSLIKSNWTVANYREGTTISTTFPSGQSLFTSGSNKGATICYSYENGTLTNKPLWPWPMNQRIIDAMKASGRTAVDVTATIESMFGPIPSQCKRSQ
jgi:hypothetical protein